MSARNGLRAAVDVGGTFTDAVTTDETGRLLQGKALTTYPDPTAGFQAALAKIGTDVFEYVGYGTTLATNAVLTRAGVKTALLTTRGFRDVLEIRRTHRSKLFDIYEEIPLPLVERPLRKEVTERIDAKGDVVCALVEEEVIALAKGLRESGVEAVAVCYLFSFLNPVHERRTRELLLEHWPDLSDVALSSEVLPLHREYERTSTTVLNAYLMPLVREYFSQLEGELRQSNKVEWLQVMQSNGGLVRPQRAAHFPVLTLLSGPAGGAIGSAFLGNALGESRLLTLDMGGTSCDVTGIENGSPDTRIDFEIDGYAVSYPTIDIHTVGAGGGSIASVDRFGHVRVGPESAKASPGPACYGLGGNLPTVTDANLILGLYDAQALLGGELALDVDLARDAIKAHVADPLDISIEEAAAGVIRIVNAHMTHALRAVSIERGRDPRDYVLVAFGGAGPVHGSAIAQELAISRVIIPPIPGCNSAFGILTSDVRHDLVDTLRGRLVDLSEDVVQGKLRRLLADARQLLEEDRVGGANHQVMASLDLRYVGQAYEINVPLRSLQPSSDDLRALVHAFHVLHGTRYGHSFEDEFVEVVNVRVVGIGRIPKPPLAANRGAPTSPYGRRKVLLPGGDVLDVALYVREELAADQEVQTPCIIHQVDATTFVPPGCIATVHHSGALVMDL